MFLYAGHPLGRNWANMHQVAAWETSHCGMGVSTLQHGRSHVGPESPRCSAIFSSKLQKLPSFIMPRHQPSHDKAWMLGPSILRSLFQAQIWRRLIKGVVRALFGNFLRGEKIKAKERKEELNISLSNSSFLFSLSMFSFVLLMVNPFRMF